MLEGNFTNGQLNQPKKRVLFVITQSEFGGAQRFLYNLISRLEPLKYEFLLVTGESESPDFLLTSLQPLGVSTKKIKSLRRQANFVADLKTTAELRKIIKEFKPSVMFLNSSRAGFLGALAVRFPTRINTVRVIYRIGGWSFNDPWPAWKRFLFTQLERLSAGWKDFIIVNNLKDFNRAQQLGIRPRQELLLIPNGLDVYKMKFLPKEEARLKIFEKIAKQAGKIFQVKTVIGTIANLYPTKGLNYLIEAAEFFKPDKDVVFVVIGAGPEKANLEKMIAEKGLTKKIFLVGQISDAYRWLPAFDVFVLPSVKEGFSWALIEAMAAKLPVIATAVGAASEIIEDNKNGSLVEPMNPHQLAARIKEVLENATRRQERGILAHQTILLKYDLDKMVNQIEKLLE